MALCDAASVDRVYPKMKISNVQIKEETMLKPLGKNVAIALITEKEKMEGDFYIPETAAGIKKGVVKFVGPKVNDVTEGETVILPKGELMEVDYKGEKYIILHEEHIVAVI